MAELYKDNTFDYSKDLENKQILGRINGAFYLRSGGKAEITSYLPYNIIFTNNFGFGELLSDSPKITSKPIFTHRVTHVTDANNQDLIGDKLTPEQYENKVYGFLRDYISKSSINYSSATIDSGTNEINQEFAYDSVKDISLRQVVLNKKSLLKTDPVLKCGGITFDVKRVIAYEGLTFFFNPLLFNEVTNLLKKVRLDAKLHVSETVESKDVWSILGY